MQVNANCFKFKSPLKGNYLAKSKCLRYFLAMTRFQVSIIIFNAFYQIYRILLRTCVVFLGRFFK